MEKQTAITEPTAAPFTSEIEYPVYWWKLPQQKFVTPKFTYSYPVAKRLAERTYVPSTPEMPLPYIQLIEEDEEGYREIEEWLIHHQMWSKVKADRIARVYDRR
jgi:hypothetical protein